MSMSVRLIRSNIFFFKIMETLNYQNNISLKCSYSTERGKGSPVNLLQVNLLQVYVTANLYIK